MFPASKAIGNTLDQDAVSSSSRVSQYFSYMISSNPSEIAGIPEDQMTKNRGREKKRNRSIRYTIIGNIIHRFLK